MTAYPREGVLYCFCKERVQASEPGFVDSSSAEGRRQTFFEAAREQAEWIARDMEGVGGWW